MSTILDELKLKYNSGTIVTKLIYINILLFFSLLIIDLLLKFLGSSILSIDLFGLTSDKDELLWKPWRILTYALLHGNLWHLGLNMILLYFVGQLFLKFFRSNNLLTFYVFGALAGGLFYVVFSTVYKHADVLIGASAAIYALFFGLISYNPKLPVRMLLIPTSFPLLYIGYAFIAIDLYNIITDSNAGGSISHFGGAVFGYLYMKQFEKGNDFLGNFADKIINIFKKKEHKFTTQRGQKHGSQVPKDDYAYNHQKVEKQKKIDAILDKIAKSGYESLSKQEKDFLFKEGR